MKAVRIDAIAKLFAARRTRRAVLGRGIGAAASAGLAPLAARTAAQEATPTGTPEVMRSTDPHPSADAPPKSEYLFVQPFAGGSWAPKADEDGVFTLTLSGAAAQTVYFSDRPDRVFGLGPTQQFLDQLGFTPANPPNAALVARTADDAPEEVLVVELLNPSYDPAASTLTYDARVLVDYGELGLAHAARLQTDYELPERFGSGGLFIDSGPNCGESCATCYKVVNGAEQTIGLIHNIGMCAHGTSVFGVCKPCHDDGTSQYYGGLCHDAFPEQCSHGCDATGCSWDCYATMLDNCEPAA